MMERQTYTNGIRFIFAKVGSTGVLGASQRRNLGFPDSLSRRTLSNSNAHVSRVLRAPLAQLQPICDEGRPQGISLQLDPRFGGL